MIPLLERSDELGVLRENAQLAMGGSPRFVVIEGPAGIGKTTLLDEFGATLRVRCDELAQAYRVLARLTADAAPVLLAVDDVHLADEPSLRRLLYLARHLVDVPLLMVLTRRTGRHQAALTELVLHPRCTVVRPCPLSVASTSAVLADLLGVGPAAELVRSYHGLTAGNPLLTRALGLSLSGLSDWDGATLPTSAVRVVADLLLAWLSDLTEDAQEFARALAVLGDTRDREPGRDRLPDLSRLGPDRPGREDKTPGRFPVPQRLPRLAINRPATDALNGTFATSLMP